MIFTIPEVVLLLIQLVLTLPVTIGIISLFCYQISCLTSNCTNVETFLYKRYKRGAKLHGINFVWFYDYGIIHNVKQVMGQSIKEWFIPTTPDHIKNGNGVEWKTRQFELRGVKRDMEDQPPDESAANRLVHKRQTKVPTEEGYTTTK